MENRGRDVRPFLTLLERGRLDRYSYVCKVHGKKSTDGGRKSYMGSLWRRRLLFDLLAAPGLAQSIIDLFERDPSIGMVGPRAFRLPSETYSEELSWSINKDRVLRTGGDDGRSRGSGSVSISSAGRCSGSARRRWRRFAQARALRRRFRRRSGLLDGGLEHATERLFGAAVVAAGYRLADSDGYGASGRGTGARAGTESRRTGLG